MIVHGRLKERTYDDKDGIRRSSLEIDAVTVGHDLTRGVAAFTKATGPRRDERPSSPTCGDAALPDDHPARMALDAVATAGRRTAAPRDEAVVATRNRGRDDRFSRRPRPSAGSSPTRPAVAVLVAQPVAVAW